MNDEEGRNGHRRPIRTLCLAHIRLLNSSLCRLRYFSNTDVKNGITFVANLSRILFP